jgi:hypothetical protein
VAPCDMAATWNRPHGSAFAPHHGWRNRFKTVGRETGVDSRVLDAIQGHAAKTAGDNYGVVSLKAMAEATGKLPQYGVDGA